MAIGALDVSLLHAGIDQPNDPAAEHEQVADLKLLDEIFLDRTEPPPAQQHIDETFRMDGADVDQELARDSRMRQRDDAILDADLAEHSGVLFCEGSAAALEILENAVEFLAAQIAKRISAADQARTLHPPRSARPRPSPTMC